MRSQLPPLDDLVACPECDTLHHATDVPENARAYCNHCGVVLMTSQSAALGQILALALTAFILMIAAISFPFLELSAAGQSNSISVLQAVVAFNEGIALVLAAAVSAFIVFVPLLRLGAIIFAISPLVAGRPPQHSARAAFGLAERLRPWSMAEIFIIGVAVALIKVAGLASLSLGPAFWAFGGLVIITVLKDQLICRYSVWEALQQSPR